MRWLLAGATEADMQWTRRMGAMNDVHGASECE
jgi:hypothetical protein